MGESDTNAAATWEQAVARLEPMRERLWEQTQTDWDMTVHWTLTEPVCPFVRFSPERGKYSNGAWGDTVPEALMNALDALEKDLPEFIEKQASKWWRA